MSTHGEQKVFSGWVYIQPAEDLPGCWVGHLLEYNIVSQGSSPSEALAMVREAAGLAFLDDLNSGLDPEARKAQALPEDFEPWQRMLRKPTLTPVSQLNPALHREFAVPVSLSFTKCVDEATSAPAISQSAPVAA